MYHETSVFKNILTTFDLELSVMITNYNSLTKDIALNYKRWVALEINLKFIKIVTKIMIYYYLLDFVRSYTAATGW